MVSLISEGTIFAGTPNSPTANSCFPAIVELPGGTLLASWRVGSQKDSADGQILLSRSTDAGVSWSEAERFADGPWTAQPGEVHYAPLTVLGPDHVMAVLMWVDRSQPGRPFFNPATEGLLPLRTWFCESRDAGRTWGDYRWMDVDAVSSCIGCNETPQPDCPLAITGPVLALPDRRLACQFEVNKPYEDTKPWRHAAAYRVSSDGGRTWPEYVEVANDPTGRVMYWDARYAFDRTGRGIVAFWTYDRQRQCDANIHLSESSDAGRTWTMPRDLGLVGQVCHPVPLGGDRLLLVYVDRFRTRSLRAALSNDMGRSFVDDIVVYQHPAAHADCGQDSTATDYLQDMELWTFGRVEAILADDGTVSVIYYAGNAQATDIRHARLRV